MGLRAAARRDLILAGCAGLDQNAREAGLLRIFGAPDVAKLWDRRDVPGLAKALGHKEPKVRVDAAEALGQVGDARALDALIGALDDSFIAVRQLAAKALARLGEERSVEPLVRALHDPSPDVRLAAATALNRFAPSARDQTTRVLIDLIEHSKVGMHHAAEQELRRMRSGRAVDAGEQTHRVDRLVADLAAADPRARAKATQVLGVLGWTPTTAEERYLVAIAGEDWRAIEAAGPDAERVVVSLLDKTTPPARGSHVNHVRFVVPAVEVLGKIGGVRSLPAVLRVVAQRWEAPLASWEVKPRAQEALASVVAAVARDGNKDDRLQAVEDLARGSDPVALTALLAFLHDREAEVGTRAGAALLAIIGSGENSEPSPAVLEALPDAFLAVVTAGEGGVGETAVPAYLRALGALKLDPAAHAKVIEAAGEVIRLTDDPAVLDQLVATVGADDRRRQAAVEVVEVLAEPSAVAALISSLFEFGSFGAEVSTVRALAAIGAAHREARRRIAEELQPRAAEALKALNDRPHDRYAGLVHASLGLLGQCSDARCLGLLLEASAHPWVAGTGVDALEAVLARSAPGEAAEEHVRAAAELDGVIERYWVVHSVVEGGYDSGGLLEQTRAVDCSPVRRLARAELARRSG